MLLERHFFSIIVVEIIKIIVILGGIKMINTSPLVITISRQLGSGGAYVGQQLAKNLNIYYADREIIIQAAQKLSQLEEKLEARDEKLTSFWQACLQSCAYCSPDAYLPPQFFVPTDQELFKAEADVIQHIAKESSAIIIGRCGGHILRNHPNHISIFLHGAFESRKIRVQNLYNVSSAEAEKMIIKSDKERARHYHTHTGKDWTDSRQYDISIDTSKIGLDKSVKLILKYIEIN